MDEKIRLGGMALRNGVLVHGPTAWACAVRLQDGSLKVASGRKRLLGAAIKSPFIRGPVRLLEAIRRDLDSLVEPDHPRPVRQRRMLHGKPGCKLIQRTPHREHFENLLLGNRPCDQPTPHQPKGEVLGFESKDRCTNRGTAYAELPRASCSSPRRSPARRWPARIASRKVA